MTNLGGDSGSFSVDLRSPEFARDPYPIYKNLRENFPVARTEDGIYLLSRYGDVKSALKNFSLFASGWSNAAQAHPQWMRSDYKRSAFMTETDPPQHDVYNALVNKAFVSRAINTLAPSLRASAQTTIERMLANGGSRDFLTDFAYPLAGAAIGAITGLDINGQFDRARLWIDLAESFTEQAPAPTQKSRMEAIVLDQHSYYDEIIKQRRMQPANDVATLLARAEVDGERLTDQQLYTALNLFTVAGFQAPAQQLSMAVMLLARQPDLVAQLIREPTKISDFIEEILRFDNPTLGLLRQTTGAVEMHGATIPAGAGVALLIGAANRDPQQFPAPDRFELARANIKTHLGFGHGAHTCLGAALARLEMRIGLEVLLPYIERIELPNNTQLIWHSTFIGRLLRGLPIRWKS